MTTRQKGQRAEALACAALRRAGYTIIERNWRCPAGELDLIARHRGDIVFVEVRSRADGADAALESITSHKRTKLIGLAQAYLAAHDLDDAAYRIDVVAVGPASSAAQQPDVEIIEDAIGW